MASGKEGFCGVSPQPGARGKALTNSYANSNYKLRIGCLDAQRNSALFR